MSKCRRNLLLATLLAAPLVATPALAEKFGLGREALPEEINAWTVEVFPDGKNLPEGSGSVADGEKIFADNCAVCHGDFAEGVDNWPKLAGGEGTLANKDPVKTVGSYWPYLSTVWDYAHRSMPFGNAQTLTVDETYAIVAYILYSNYLVEDDFVLTKDNFLDVEMPNADGFIVDNRDEVEVPKFSEAACMSDCKTDVHITKKATVLDVTPNQGGGEDTAAADDSAPADVVVAGDATQSDAAEAMAQDAPAAAQVEKTTSEPKETLSADPALVEAGEKVFKKCKACHQVGEDAKNRVGPVLNNLIGRQAGTADGFKYSSAMKQHGEDGLIWTEQTVEEYLADPKGYIPKNRMSFAGLKDPEDVKAVLAYIESQGG
ncbi:MULTISPECIES: c-type cytochrome [Thioclava]|uniref:MFS transporter n=1 Tax=Thioclava nitratireducens TaxID=1915078 RepID=A0ABN4XC84_9RHOB|nr:MULTISPECIES: c-type cytochrome [Thioclava]AQS48857.1 MFS transporter [Thioclava nitratireducens]OWY01778.1 MFS transporter [Thioclava sp. F1Mire-8]OWY10083.1 MFS transporter [Thioclava sp. F42-5]OWY12261.1 MFS transporter [Thioclava sp. F34-6]OWY17372.1 MFS transporter [Thioclava sp. JM3]